MVRLASAGTFAAWMATACGSSNDDAVLATGRHCLIDDESDACVRAVTVAATADELATALVAWGYEASSVPFPGHPVVFLPFSDTSNCHPLVNDVSVDGDTVDIETDFGGVDCTSEYIPYSFVIDPGAETISSVTVNGRPIELTPPLG